MRKANLIPLLSGCVLLTACAGPGDVVKGTTEFLVFAASQDEYVQACETRGNSSLECQAAYADTREGHQAYYQAQKKRERQQATDELSAELDAYFESSGDDPRPD